MAKGRKKKGGGRKKKRSRNLEKGQVPLMLLEYRLKKLHHIVDSRGGHTPGD